MVVLILIYFGCIIIIGILSNIKYRIFLEFIRQEDDELNNHIDYDKAGWWVGGTYVFKFPMPIIRNSIYPGTQKVILQHNRLVRIFWFCFVLLIPLIFILNFYF